MEHAAWGREDFPEEVGPEREATWAKVWGAWVVRHWGRQGGGHSRQSGEPGRKS